jgi:hypothetical protein
MGRRGSVKTTILLAAIIGNCNNLSIRIDCQNLRKKESDDTLIQVLRKILEGIYTNFDNKHYEEIKKKYNDTHKGVEGILNISTSRQDETQQEVLRCQIFLDIIDTLILSLNEIEKYPNEIIYKTKYNKEAVTSKEENTKREFGFKGELLLEGELELKYKVIGAKIKSVADITSNYSSNVDSKDTSKTQVTVNSEYERIVKKSELLDELYQGIIQLFNEYNSIVKRNIILYLDDFYQISINKQPRIIQFFHDIHKNCENSSFCFKLCCIPNSLKLNNDGETLLSAKDDFSVINLDTDLSNLESLKHYLIEIICSLDKALQLTSNDIESLFGKYALLYTIIATGGIPRDYLIMFSELIRTVRANNRDKVLLEDVLYLIVPELKEDKEENIVYDSNITPEMLAEAKEKIKTEVVEGNETNLFLYPISRTEEEEILLRNLVNDRFLHLIKESVSSENI